jgi:hypothetical protein
MFCRERAARFAQERDQLDAAGVSLAFVGNGNLLMAQDFAKQFHVTDPLYTDPGKASYKALGLPRKFGLMKSLGRGRRAGKAGFKQGKVAGDPWQQGGIVLFAQDGSVLWKHVDDGAGHSADIDAFRAAVKAV